MTEKDITLIQEEVKEDTVFLKGSIYCHSDGRKRQWNAVVQTEVWISKD